MQDDVGSPPLIEPSARGHLDTVKLLIDRGATVDGQNKVPCTHAHTHTHMYRHAHTITVLHGNMRTLMQLLPRSSCTIHA